MRKSIAACAILAGLFLPAWAQIDQQEYWRQVDEQRQREEQQRWANEQAEMARMNAEAYQQDLYDREQQRAEEEEWRNSQPSMGPPDEMSVRFAQVGAMASVAHDLLDNPELQRYAKGFWEYHDIEGQYRSAMFISPAGVISLHGPGGGYDGALLMLWGPNIPRPEAMTLLPVTLQQDEEAPTTVQTFNLGFPSVENWGTLIFVVPSQKALVDSMLDNQHFTASIDGKEVFSGSWHDGRAAAAKLNGR